MSDEMELILNEELDADSVLENGGQVPVLITSPGLVSEDMTELNIPEGVSVLGERALMNTHFRKITLPESMKVIEDEAFIGCHELECIVIPEGLEKIGCLAFSGCSALRSVVFPSTLKNIADKAFYGCNSLKNIVVPETVEQIGDQAFSFCQSLESVELYGGGHLGKSVFSECCSLKTALVGRIKQGGGSMFEKCYSLEQITFSDNVWMFPDKMCALCISLEKVTVPPSVGLIGNSAFYRCERLQEVIFDEHFYDPEARVDSNIDYAFVGFGKNSFAECYKLKKIRFPVSVMGIIDNAFSCCFSLEEVIMPQRILQIGTEAFSFCTALREIEIYDVKDVEVGIFQGCSSLASVRFIGTRFENITDNMFLDCTSLREVAVPDNVSALFPSAFQGCTALERITLPCDLKQIMDSCFEGCSALREFREPSGTSGLPEKLNTIGEKAFYGCVSLTSLDIPDEVSSIKFMAFSGCTGLRRIKLSDKMTEIPGKLFEDCTALEEIGIPSCLKELGGLAFKNCASLRELVLPETLWHGGQSCFEGCSALEKLVIPNTEYPLVGFPGCGRKVKHVFIPGIFTSFGNESVLLDVVYVFLKNKGCYTKQESGINRSLIKRCIVSITIVAVEENDIELLKLLMKNGLVPLYLLNEIIRNGDAFESVEALSSLMEYAGSFTQEQRANEEMRSLMCRLGAEGDPLLWDYRENGDGVVILGEKLLCKHNVVPAVLCGKPVKKLASPVGLPGFSGSVDLKMTYTRLGVSMDYENRGFGVNELVVSEGIEEIASYTFCKNDVFYKIWLPDSLKKLGKGIFMECSKLVELRLPAGLEEIPDKMFSGACLKQLDIPQGVKRIGKQAFSRSNFTKLVLPEGLEEIGTGAFMGCTLNRVEIPGKVHSISSNAFTKSALEVVSICEGVREIEEMAFADCGRLRLVKIPESVTRIAPGAFRDCRMLFLFVKKGSYAEEYAVRYGLRHKFWR